MNICHELQIFKRMSRLLIDITNRIRDYTKNKKFNKIYYQVAKWYIYNLGKECDRKIPILPEDVNLTQLYVDIQNTDDTNLNHYPDVEKLIISKLKKTRRRIEEIQKEDICEYVIRNDGDRVVYVPTDSKRNRYHVDITPELYQKLRSTYNGPQDQMDEHIFILLLRYTLFGSKKETISLSVNFVYDNPKLLDKIPLEVELFGSPVNRNLDKFCSLYPDIERYWGSIGSFFCLEDKYFEKYRYFVSNPPYDNIIMAEASEKIIDVLDKFGDCCFIVSIPDWRPQANLEGGKYADESYEAYDILKKSPHLKFERIYTGDFEYTDYFRSKKITIGKTGTIIMVLSNFDTPIEYSDFDI
jgi:Phosphorylated CTD interacting factor 1 WW domain